MRILYEPSGLHTHKGLLKARFDLYPVLGDALYAFHRIPDTSKGTYTGKEL